MAKVKGKPKAKAAVDDIWFGDEHATALPDDTVPELQRRAKQNKRLTKGIWVAMVAGPLAIVLALIAIIATAETRGQVESIDLTPTAETAPLPQLQVQEITSPGRFAATQALESWLATVPNPLPGGRIVSWDGATEQDAVDSEAAASGTLAVTLEQFTVVDGAGTAYRVTYQVASDPVGGGASVLAGPSLQARVQPATGITQGEVAWPGLETSETPDPVAQAVQTWADAYVSGSPERLHLAVGDTNQDRTYVPISGATHAETAVLASAALANEDDDADQQMIVRAEVQIGWEGRDADPSPASIQMDLLVSRSDTGAPVIVAWGSPGSGPDLHPFENAVPVMSRQAPGGEDDDPDYDDSGTAPEPAPTDSPDETEQTEEPGTDEDEEDDQ